MALSAFDGDIRTRFDFVSHGARGDCIKPRAVASEDVLKRALRENVTELIDGNLSIAGLKSLLARRPTLLYQTTVSAKQFLGVGGLR